ncbi:MAG: asparagine synthase (glutamine-hydrolyzing) [Verrucomicrobia bacterium]|nr:asparagine synthase (glutamine-hydrolyzing) [Verrucomicrobiota bacterium]
MCAICGIVNFDGRPVEERALVSMRDVMVNRGPDAAGIYLKNHAALGHRRLSIIDLSPLGNQPMTNEDGTIWTVFNGEIYNFPELRRELLDKGHVFRSGSDTEVILHGYEQWGERVFSRMDGMFAIGLWDERNERLFLARDRFGKKPLYYTQRGATVMFSSDIKSFWTLDPQRFTLNPQAVDCYLHHLAVTQEHCIFNEVEKVHPAHYREFNRRGTRETRYWAPGFQTKLHASEGEVLGLMDTKLREAVRKRLVSDVPLGAFLSGGVDSSLVVAMMSQLTDKPVKTFSIGFEEQDFSELEYSRAVAKRWRTDHKEIVLKPDVLAILPSLVWEYGEPFADSSAIPTYYVSKAAREFVTVALSGDGGDELFGGYDTAKASYWAYHYDRFCPAGLRARLEAKLLPPGGVASGSAFLRKLRTVMVHAHPDPAVRHSFSMAFAQHQKDALYTAKFRESLHGHHDWHIFDDAWRVAGHWNVIDQNLFFTLAGRLPNDYLVKVDVASMKASLELRSPLLDTDLATLAGSIDPLLKVRRGKQKYLLKKLAERYLPWEVIYRPKKGFSLPLKHWLRGEMKPLLDRLLPDGKLVGAGWFNRDYVQRLITEHSAGTDHTHRLWSLLWLELWWRLFIDRSLKPTDSLK